MTLTQSDPVAYLTGFFHIVQPMMKTFISLSLFKMPSDWNERYGGWGVFPKHRCCRGTTGELESPRLTPDSGLWIHMSCKTSPTLGRPPSPDSALSGSIQWGDGVLCFVHPSIHPKYSPLTSTSDLLLNLKTIALNVKVIQAPTQMKMSSRRQSKLAAYESNL